MSRSILSVCVAGVGSVALLVPGAAYAADHGARGEANALTATVLGESADTGTVRATNDGTGEERTGPVNPLPTVLPDQGYAGIGVLAQDAVATDDGRSAACAGIAGDGGSANVVEVGDSDCIEPGDNITLQLAELDLSEVLDGAVVDGGDTTLAALLTTLTAGESEQLVAALQGAVDELETQLGNAGLVLDAGAVESACTYDGQAEGTTFLADAGIRLVIPGVGEETVVDFAPEPAPDTRPVAQSDDVIALVLTELEQGLGANLDALTGVVFDTLLTEENRDAIVGAAVDQLEPALEQIEANVLDIVLNRQTRDGESIAVTGLAVSVLPAARDIVSVLDLEVANVGCGPMPAAAGPGTTGDGGAPATDSEGNPVPTTVNAGARPEGGAAGGLTAWLAGLLGLGAAAAYRVRRVGRG